MALLNIYEPGQTPAPHQPEEVAVGIDLGTTNSLVAISQNQKPEIIFDKDGNFMQPSIVAISQDNLIAGLATKNIDGEKIYSIKRLMGKGFDDVKKIQNLPFQIKKSGEQLKVILGDKELSAVEISAQILETLKNIAEENLQKTISKAVITVPAYFDEAARNATKQAANLAGLEVLRLISEPTAAAVAYGLDKQAEGKFLVFDLGGGTFDASILELSKGVFKVIGVGGDSALGGDDFDNLIGQQIITGNNLQNLSVLDLQNIKLSAKAIKENLTKQALATVKVNLENQIIQFSISQKEKKLPP
jgi:molecular chaperone HscA